VADRVTDLILNGEKELGYFSLHAFVIMPNHVHLLMAPKRPLQRIMNGIKGSTAHSANTILGRTGKPFWQDESFDSLGSNGKRIRKHLSIHRMESRNCEVGSTTRRLGVA
jgi:REP element-mobilizing transposase RayT